MTFNATTYHAKDTPVHALDARVKIVLVLVYSIALFCIHTWKGMALLAVVVGVAAFVARLNLIQAARQLIPLGILLLVALLANAFVFDVTAPPPTYGAVSAGVFSDAAPIPLIGNFGISPAGLVRGCFAVLRIVLLVCASLILTTSTAPTQVTAALTSFLSPLRRVNFPVRDAATIVSIALRFIPVTIDQFQQVRYAQSSRGALFDTGKLMQRLRAWQTVFIPLFVGLFRHADNLAIAMDARAYGLGEATSIESKPFTPASIAVLAAGCILCGLIGWVF